MNECLKGIDFCESLVIKTAKKEQFKGNYFFGCLLYPECKRLIPTGFNENKITENEKKLINAFDCFVNLNSFLSATYGTIYFNFRNPGLLDYALKTDIIKDYKDPIEIGETNAKIFYTLFYHLFIIPDKLLKLYLQYNFPESYKRFINKEKPKVFNSIDYENNKVKEKEFIKYKNAYLNY